VTATAVGCVRVARISGALAIQNFTGIGEKGAMQMKNRGTKGHAKSVALAAVLAAGTMGYAHAADIAPMKAAPAVPFFFVNDTSVSSTFFFKATDPGVSGGSGTTPGGIGDTGNTMYRAQFSIDHFDVWQYGTNFIHGEFNQYGDSDPDQGVPGSWGTREFFGFWTGTLGFNELGHTKAFSTWATKDVSLMLNLTGGVQNNFLAEETTQIAPGIQFTLNLPGTVNVGITAYKEWSYNTFDSCGPFGFGVAYGGASGACGNGFAGDELSGDRSFEWAWKLFTFISEPIPGTPVTWINVLNVTGPKGTGYAGPNVVATCGTGIGLTQAQCLADAETKTEVFEDARLSLDTSKVLWGKPGIWDTYVGYRYWYNKFGTDHTAPLFAGTTLSSGPFGAPGTSIESTAYVGTTYHFK
jgi:hypothetical protein